MTGSSWVREEVGDNIVIRGRAITGAQRAISHVIIQQPNEASKTSYSLLLLLVQQVQNVPLVNLNYFLLQTTVLTINIASYYVCVFLTVYHTVFYYLFYFFFSLPCLHCFLFCFFLEMPGGQECTLVWAFCVDPHCADSKISVKPKQRAEK